MFSAAVVTADVLAHSLDEPDLVNKLRSFSTDQTCAGDYNSDASLMDDSDNQLPEIDDLITLYPSAVATYFAPSDLSGIGGMHSERIRATSNWRNEGPRYDTVFVNTNPNKDWILHASSNSFRSNLKVTSIRVPWYNGILLVVMSQTRTLACGLWNRMYTKMVSLLLT